ncbi:MAG TPA: hypothetical protein VE135_13750 [Pyrinomonadaceae bacterium]|nr:hypothetical protein [Pyrinomonadaceae bacterium]
MSRNFKIIEGVKTVDVWGVTQFTESGCYLLDRYAAEAKLTPSQFLGTLIASAFKAHIAAHPLSDDPPTTSEQPNVAEQPKVETEAEGKLELVAAGQITKRNRRRRPTTKVA